MRLEPGSAPAQLEETPLTVPGSFPLAADNILIQLELAGRKSSLDPCGTLKATELYVGDLASPLVLRGLRPGDHYWPEGDLRDRTLKELFQSARIPSWRRRDWPMITSGTKILWVRQFGAAKEFSASARRKGRILRVIEIAGGK